MKPNLTELTTELLIRKTSDTGTLRVRLAHDENGNRWFRILSNKPDKKVKKKGTCVDWWFPEFLDEDDNPHRGYNKKGNPEVVEASNEKAFLRVVREALKKLTPLPVAKLQEDLTEIKQLLASIKE